MIDITKIDRDFFGVSGLWSEFVDIASHDYHHPFTICMDGIWMSASACQVCTRVRSAMTVLSQRQTCAREDADVVSSTRNYPQHGHGCYRPCRTDQPRETRKGRPDCGIGGAAFFNRAWSEGGSLSELAKAPCTGLTTTRGEIWPTN